MAIPVLFSPLKSIPNLLIPQQPSTAIIKYMHNPAIHGTTQNTAAKKYFNSVESMK